MNQNQKVDSFFDQALADHSTASNLFAKLKARHKDIEKLIDTGWTHQQICDGLNENGVEISFKTFRTYLYRMRKSGPPSHTKNRRATTPHPAGISKPTSKSESVEDPKNQDDWNDTEKLIGYRLEDCIRPYVRVEDGKIIRNFRKGTIHSPQARQALARLHERVHPD